VAQYHKSVIVHVDGNKIKLTTGISKNGSVGRTQTVNIFDHLDTEGNYSQVYRLFQPNCLPEGFNFSKIFTLEELEKILMALGAVKEGPRQGARR
jgi:hypothetical protein